MTGDSIETGDIQGVGIAVGTGASVKIYGDVHYYPIVLRAPLREVFDPLIEDRVRLFGGRTAIIDRIMRRIQELKGGYTVVTAPAGFGKTALMATLVHHTPAAFAYHFFTPLYGSDSLSEVFFLRNVVQQMAEWHEHKEQLPTDLNELRALYQHFLDTPLDRVRILVLDGLDEVTDWSLKSYLSRRLPEHLSLLVTVRDVGQDWRSDYSLPADQVLTIPLGGLARDEIAAVLAQAGERGVALVNYPSALDALLYIAAYTGDPILGADPFYVRLLAEDIEASAISSANIADQPRGLDAYLDRWWQEIQRGAGDVPTRDLFGTLAVALGPIARADLEVINPSLVDDWSRDHFNEVLRQVRRFIGGDAEQGYALMHPRLRQYLRQKIRTERYQKEVLDYCARWPEHHSAYALDYYAQHLAAEEDWEKLRTLVVEPVRNIGSDKQPWAEAHFAARANYAGYLAGVNILWQHAEQSADVALTLRCALIETSLRSLSGALPSPLLAELVAVGTPQGKWSAAAALEHVQQMPHDGKRSLAIQALARRDCAVPWAAFLKIACTMNDFSGTTALRAIAPRLAGIRIPQEILAQAMQTARGLSDRLVGGLLLAELAPHLHPEQQREVYLEVIAAVGSGRSSMFSYDVKVNTIVAYFPPWVLPDVVAKIEAMPDAYSSADILTELAPRLPTDLLSTALRIARTKISVYRRPDLLAALARRLAPDAQLAVYEEALDAVLSIPEENLKAWNLEKLAPDLPGALVPRAVQMVHALSDVWERARSLVAYIPRLPQAEQNVAITEAFAIIQPGDQSKLGRERLLNTLTSFLSGAERLNVYAAELDVIQRNSDDRRCMGALEGIIPYLPELLLPQAHSLIQSLRDDYARAQSFAALARRQPEVYPAALAAALRYAEKNRSDEVLHNLAPYLPLELVEEAVKALKPAWDKLHSWERLVVRLPVTQQQELYARALAENRIVNDREVCNGLHALLASLPWPLPSPGSALVTLAAQEPRCVPYALTSLAAINNEAEQAESLAALASHLPASLIYRALLMVQRFANVEHQILVLVALAPHLPPVLHQRVVVFINEIKSPKLRQQALKAFPLRPHPDLTESIVQMLEHAETIPTSRARADALIALAGRLPRSLLLRALNIAAAIPHDLPRANALEALIPDLLVPQSGPVAQHLLHAVLAIVDRPLRGRTLLTLIPYLSTELDAIAFGIAPPFRDENEQAKVLSDFAPVMNMVQIHKALNVAYQMTTQHLQHDLIAALAPYLPPSLLPQALAFAVATMKFTDSSLIAKLGVQLPFIVGTNYGEETWHRTIRELVTRDRAYLFTRLLDLAPWLIAVAPNSLNHVASAIDDVAYIWP